MLVIRQAFANPASTRGDHSDLLSKLLQAMSMLLRTVLVFWLQSVVLCKVCDVACEEQRANQELRKKISVLGEELLSCLSQVPRSPEKPLAVGHGIPVGILNHNPHGHLVQLSLMKQLHSLIKEMKKDIRQCQGLLRRQTNKSRDTGNEIEGTADVPLDTLERKDFRKMARLGTKLIRKTDDENNSSLFWKNPGKEEFRNSHVKAVHVNPGTISRKVNQSGKVKTGKKFGKQLVRQRFYSLINNRLEKPTSKVFYG